VHAEFSVSRPTSGASTRTRIGIVNSYGFAFPPKTVRNLTDAQMIALLEFM
jgi:hypothetical protein